MTSLPSGPGRVTGLQPGSEFGVRSEHGLLYQGQLAIHLATDGLGLLHLLLLDQSPHRLREAAGDLPEVETPQRIGSVLLANLLLAQLREALSRKAA